MNERLELMFADGWQGLVLWGKPPPSSPRRCAKDEPSMSWSGSAVLSVMKPSPRGPLAPPALVVTDGCGSRTCLAVTAISRRSGLPEPVVADGPPVAETSA